jgi:hypothetical protein
LEQNDFSRLDGLLDQLISNVSTIRRHRNKTLAHTDLKLVLQPNELPRLTYGELESAMETCRSIMADLTSLLFAWSTHYDVLIPYGCDGVTLIEVLKAGNFALESAA